MPKRGGTTTRESRRCTKRRNATVSLLVLSIITEIGVLRRISPLIFGADPNIPAGTV